MQPTSDVRIRTNLKGYTPNNTSNSLAEELKHNCTINFIFFISFFSPVDRENTIFRIYKS